MKKAHKKYLLCNILVYIIYKDRNGIMNIQFPNKEIFNVSLISPGGKTISVINASGKSVQIDTRSLVHGVYLVHISIAGVENHYSRIIVGSAGL
jgi:hypothetical protein